MNRLESDRPNAGHIQCCIHRKRTWGLDVVLNYHFHTEKCSMTIVTEIYNEPILFVFVADI